jgi:hypothetical protein
MRKREYHAGRERMSRSRAEQSCVSKGLEMDIARRVQTGGEFREDRQSRDRLSRAMKEHWLLMKEVESH